MASDTTPKPAFGITVTWAGHDIGYLTDVKGPSMKADEIDISNHDSPNGFRQFVAGLRDGGEITLEMKYIPGSLTGQKFLLADFNSGTEQQMVITYADGSTWTLNGIVTGFEPDAGAIDNARLLSVTVKATGKPVFVYT